MRTMSTVLGFIFLSSTLIFAQEENKLPFDISGFVDGYYMYNFNEQGYATSFTEAHNSFSLGMANLVLSKEGKVGFVADLAVGPRALAANGVFDDPTLSVIKQLYVTYSPSDAVTFTFGNFSTFVGYELIDSPANINYSTSYLFSNGPFYHTGLKADFVLSENFGAMIGVFNDTDGKFDEVAGKHLGAQLSAEAGGLSAYLNFITGTEAIIDEEKLNEYEIDLTATYEFSDKFMLGLNAANYATGLDGENQGGFAGAALYATIGLSETAVLGLRAEQFIPTDGDKNTDDTGITALTASGNISVGNLTFIPEFRIDFSSDAIFTDADGAASDVQAGLILAAVYSF